MGTEGKDLDDLLLRAGSQFRADVEKLTDSADFRERRANAISSAVRAFESGSENEGVTNWVSQLFGAEALRQMLMGRVVLAGATLGVAIVGIYLSASIRLAPVNLPTKHKLTESVVSVETISEENDLTGLSLAYADFQDELNVGLQTPALFDAGVWDAAADEVLTDDLQYDDEQFDMEDYQDEYQQTWLSI